MSFTSFLGQNLPLALLFIALLIAIVAVEYFDSGRGTRKLSTQEAIRLMNHPKSLLLDLRDYIQFEKGYIQGAKQIALDALQHKAHEHIKKKETPVLLVDAGEQRALKMASHLKKQGFSEVHVLKGGIETWKKENLPLSKK